MSNILDRVFNDVCLDERVSDGIFKMDESAHMDALRDYFVKRGITREAAISVTNRMVEGKFPERQAFNRDGILVTFPTPQHKARAIARGTHFEKNPIPQTQQQRDSAKQEEPKQAPPGSNPEPGELPPDDTKADDTDMNDDNDDEDGGSLGGSHGGGHSSGGGDGAGGGSVFQGDKSLEVEPPRGAAIDQPPQPPQPMVAPAPRTPQRIAAEKEVVRRIFATDDTTPSNVGGPIGVNESKQQQQLRELYKKADELGLDEAVKFLTPYITS